MKEENETMDAFEAARQAFFSGSVVASSTVFTQAKSVDGMESVPALKQRPVSHPEEKLAVAR
jgi:hypothetical protein